MKRLRVILLFLLLGAIVNVVVAWGIALFGMAFNITMFEVGKFGYHYSSDGLWTLIPCEGFGSHFIQSNHAKQVMDDETVLIWRELYINNPIENVKPHWGSMEAVTNFYQSLSAPGSLEHSVVSENRVYEARGWPMLSLWSLPSISVRVDSGNYKEFEPRGFIAIPILSDNYWWPRGLSLYPIWPGFVVNTLFYAVFLWLLFTAAIALHRMIRRSRGLCVKCAYDLRGAEHEACPECGEQVAHPSPH